LARPLLLVTARVRRHVLPREAPGEEVVGAAVALRIEAGAAAIDARRSLRVPAGAVVAHVLNADGLTGELGEQRRVVGGVAGVVAAVGPGAGDPDRVNLFWRQADQLRDAVTREVRLLRARPQRGPIGAHVGHRAGRAHAGVRLERPLVLGLDHARCRLERIVDVALLDRHLGAVHLDVGDVLQRAVDLAGDDFLRNRSPDDLVLGRLLRRGLALGQQRVAVALVPLELVMEVLATDELAVRRRALALADHGDDALLHRELLGRRAELLDRALEQQAPGLGRGVAEGQRAVLNAGRAGGAALVAREGGVAHH